MTPNARQRGFAVDLVLYGIVALAVAGGAAYAVYTYTHAIKEAERMAEANKTLTASVDTLTRANQDQLAENLMQRERAKRTGELLAALHAQRAAGADNERKIDDKINAIIRTQPPVRDWADTPVPAAVLAGLRLDTAIGGAGRENHARGTATATAAARRDP